MHKLEGWGIFRAENERIQFFGWILDHPDIPDGPMTTSFVETFDEASRVVHTRNSTYQLGARNNMFQQWRAERGLPEVIRFDASNVHNVALPGLETIYDHSSSILESAEKWLTKSDWNELHPGVPMSWLRESQHEAFLRAVSRRTAERIHESV